MTLKEKIKKDIFEPNNKSINILEKTIQNCSSEEEKKIIKKYCNSISIEEKISFTDLSISKYNEIYDTIFIVYVNIKKPDKVYEVYNILAKNILYSTIIIFQYEKKKKIGVSKVRENIIKANKNVNKDIAFSSWSDRVYNNIILEINDIDMHDIKTMNGLYDKIYSIIKNKKSEATTISRAIEIICNSFIVKDKEILKKELLENCCVIYAPKGKKNKYQKSEKTTIPCIEKDEIWDFLNKDEHYSKVIKNKDIRNFLEIEEKYNNDYDKDKDEDYKINNYQIRLNYKGQETAQKGETEVFKCKMFDDKLNCCLIYNNVKSYMECIKYHYDCIYRKME